MKYFSFFKTRKWSGCLILQSPIILHFKQKKDPLNERVAGFFAIEIFSTFYLGRWLTFLPPFSATPWREKRILALQMGPIFSRGIEHYVMCPSRAKKKLVFAPAKVEGKNTLKKKERKHDFRFSSFPTILQFLFGVEIFSFLLFLFRKNAALSSLF